MRHEYSRYALDESVLPDNPLQLFQEWMEEAGKSDTPMPNAMILSTVENDGQPSSRVVLLKKIDGEKFIFFTNYNSRKAREIRGHIRVSALFFWPGCERQVKVSGIARQADVEESEEYFHSRPFESQVAAWASPQSQEISGRPYLEKEFEKFCERFKDSGAVPRPPHWGGYAIIPSRIEFWQGRVNRLHDRIEYRKENETWKYVRLAP